MSSNFNNAKIINVYYNKGDRKPYDVNGKPIAYIGEEFVGSNEGSELRFFFGEDLDSATPMIITKRPDGQTHLDLCEKVGTGANSYYKVVLNNWYAEVKGKLTLIFKVYNGTVTLDEGNTEILSASGQVIVSDIFNLEVGYAPLATSAVPPYDPDPEASWYFALSQKLDKAQSITVTGALPTLTGDVYDDRYFYVEDEGVGRLYYINGSTAIEVVFQVGTLKLTATGNGELTANTGKIAWDEGFGGFEYIQYRDVANHIGQDIEYYGKAVGTIAKGDVIQFAGTQGNHYLIKKAVPSEINANPKLIMGIAKQGLTNNEFGYVAHFGRIRGIDTSGYSMGAFLWFSSASINDGELTTTQPTAPNAKILLAVVVDVANNGTILVRPTIEPSLKELQDVNITSIANNQVLRWNGSNNRWENTSALTTAEINITDLQGRMVTAESDIDSLEVRATNLESAVDDIEDGTTIVPKALADQNGNVINTTYLTQGSASATYIPLSQKGANNGVVPLNADGKISSIYLTGEQDDYIEFPTLEDFPETGEADIIYCAIDTGLIYRWTGSTYSVISPSLALGTTSTTAFPGDRGLAVEGVLDTANQTNNRIVTWNSSTGKFDTNGSVALAPQISATSSSVHLLERTSNFTNAPRSPLSLISTTSANMFDGFGTSILFNIKDEANVNNEIGSLSFLRSGGDNSGRFVVSTRNAGVDTERMTILPNGNVGIGTSTPNLTSAGRTTVDVNGTNSSIYALSVGGVASGFMFHTGTDLLISNERNGVLGLNVNGDRRMTVLANGNVGIGTTSPSTLLHISKSSALSGASDYPSIRLDNSNASGYTGLYFYQGATQKAGLELKNDVGALTLYTGTTERMRIEANGNIGVGTTTPTLLNFGTEFTIRGGGANPHAYLNLQGTQTNDAGSSVAGFHFHNLVSGTNALIASIYGARSGANNSGRLAFVTTNAGTQTEKMTILPNGNVGIGIANPALPLDVGVTSNKSIGVRSNTNNYGYLGMFNDFSILGVNRNPANGSYADSNKASAEIALLSANADSGILFATTTTNGGIPTEKMRVTGAGNVGIGTSSPTTRLQVNHTEANVLAISRSGGTDANTGIQFNQATTFWIAGTTSTQDFAFKYNLANIGLNPEFIIKSTGLVGINETSPSAQLQVKSGATTRVPLIVDTISGFDQAVGLEEFRVNTTVVARINGFGSFATLGSIFNLTNINNANITPASTGTTISRNIADTNPALIVNLANAGATGNIQVWQKAGSAVAHITNTGGAYFGGAISESTTSVGVHIGTSGTPRILISNGTSAQNYQIDNVGGDLRFFVPGSLKMTLKNSGNLEVEGLAQFTGTPSNAQTGDYTLVLADKGKVVRINSSSNLTVTIPLNSSVAFPIDTEIAILRYGTGTVSISPTSGVTLNSKNSERKISGQYGSVALKKIGENEWVLVGSLEA